MNNIFLGTQKADYYAGGTQVDSIYLGTALVYNRETPPPPLEVPFAAIKHASGYTGMPVARLWETSTREWFMMKGDGTYTQYGIYADDISHTGYEGELAIYDGHEYEYSGGTWVDLGGKVERELPSPEYIMTTEYESQQIQLQYHVTENTKVRVKFGDYGGDGGIYFGNDAVDSNDWRGFRASNSCYFDVANSRYYSSASAFCNKNLEYGNFYIKDLDSGTFIHQGEAKEEIELPNDDFYILRDRGQMYYIDIYEGNTLKLSLRPVIHDGKCGFVDVLTGDFHIGNNMSSGGTMGSVTILTWPKSYDAIPSPDLSTVTADTLSDLEAIPDDERFLGMGGVTDSGTGHYRLSYQNEWESVTLGRAVMFQVVRTDGVTNYLRCDNPGNFDIEYTSDGGSTWWPYFEDVAFTHDNPVYVRGTSDAGFDGQLSFATASVDQTDVSGYLDALLDYTQEWEGQLPDNAFRYLFNNSYWRDCSGLILPSESGKYAYQGMFSGCTSLTVAPELPAMELKDYCYASMFSHCSSLAETPELPATKLAQHCYDIMFEHCTSLTDIAYMPTPERMYPFCYAAMYRYCTGLVHVTQTTPNVQPDDESFTSLFEGCTNLEDVPFDFLPATTLGSKPYYHLFKNCTKLTDAPELPAIRLTSLSYWAMFEGCSSLTSITANFTTLISGYMSLNNWVVGVASAGTFYRNEDLEEETIGYGNSGIPSGWTVVPPYIHPDYRALKFSTVNTGETNELWLVNHGGNEPDLEYSYDGLDWEAWDYSGLTFGNGQDLYIRGNNLSGLNQSGSIYSQFSSLTSSVTFEVSGNIMHLLDWEQELTEIPNDYCFYSLFRECRNIVSVPELPATSLTPYCYASLFRVCTSLSTAPKLPATTLASYCYADMLYSCQNISKIDSRATDISATGALSNWVMGVASEGTFYCPKGMGDVYPRSRNGIPTGWTIVEDASINALKFSTVNTGETNTLRYSTPSSSSYAPNLEYSLDGGETWVTYSKDSAVTFGNGTDMYVRGDNPNGFTSKVRFYFGNTTSLVNCEGNIMHLLSYEEDLMDVPCAYCFDCMFQACVALYTAPELPATGLTGWDYPHIFQDCTNLSAAPVLPATTMYEGSYQGMFERCPNLSGCVEIHASAVSYQGMYYMMNGCSSLTEVKAYMTDISAGLAFGQWLAGVPASGTFHCPAGMGSRYSRGAGGIPTGWTIVEDL